MSGSQPPISCLSCSYSPLPGALWMTKVVLPSMCKMPPCQYWHKQSYFPCAKHSVVTLLRLNLRAGSCTGILHSEQQGEATRLRGLACYSLVLLFLGLSINSRSQRFLSAGQTTLLKGSSCPHIVCFCPQSKKTCSLLVKYGQCNHSCCPFLNPSLYFSVCAFKKQNETFVAHTSHLNSTGWLCASSRKIFWDVFLLSFF